MLDLVNESCHFRPYFFWKFWVIVCAVKKEGVDNRDRSELELSHKKYS